MAEDKDPAIASRTALTEARALIRLMSPRRRRELGAVMLLMLAGAGAEILTLVAVVAFMSAITGRPAIPLLEPLAGLTGGTLFAASTMLLGAAGLAASVRLLLAWRSHSFVASLGQDIGVRVFNAMLRQPYATYLSRNSSEILSGIDKIQAIVYGVLLPAVQGTIALAIALAIAAMLFLLSPFATTLAAVFVGAAYSVIILATRKRLQRNSKLIAQAARDRVKAVQESLGAIRDILLEGSQDLFERKFRNLDHVYRHRQGMNLFMVQVPRFIVEAAGIGAVAIVAMTMTLRPGGIVDALPILGALALGALRLLPLLQQAYLGWSSLTGTHQSLADVVALTRIPAIPALESVSAERLAFNDAIEIDRVSFRYDSGELALQDVTVRIHKGERLGLIGRTGSGKSTFLDLMMGLLEPTGGEIRIDGRRLDNRIRAPWQANIAHVPQSIYLTDDSIAANIALALPSDRIDLDRVRWAAGLARLDHVIARLPEGLQSRVGERGTLLSGGERQQIGIARALYKRRDLLLLDEATSALDPETEAAVMKAIDELGEKVTVIFIAHKLSNAARCDRILRLDGGRLVEASAAGRGAPRRRTGATGGR